MGNYCGCDCIGKKVGMSPPVPTIPENPENPTPQPMVGTQGLLTIDMTSVLIGAAGTAVLFYLIFGSFWRRD